MPPEPVPADPPPDPMTAEERAAWLDRVAEEHEPPGAEEWEDWPGPDDELTAEDLAELAGLREAAEADALAAAEAAAPRNRLRPRRPGRDARDVGGVHGR